LSAPGFPRIFQLRAPTGAVGALGSPIQTVFDESF